MKPKQLTALFLALIMIFAVSAQAAPVTEEPDLTINAKAAFLVETTTGQVLYEYHADDKLYPASTTKLMTALVAWEHCSPGDMISVSQQAVDGLAEQGSSVFLKAGEQMEFMDMLHYLLIASGNDAANALAEHISSSNSAFAELMNEKAEELGCQNTHFANPSGLHDENHYTSARDLGIIAQAAMKIPELREIVGKTQYKLQPTNMHENETTITTTNRLISRLKDGRYFYKGAYGIKTGTTTPAGYCLIGGAQSGELDYITVVLGGEKDPETGDIGCYTETIKLLDYAKKNFSLQTITSADTPIQEVPVRFAAGKEHTKLVAAADSELLLHNDTDLSQVTYEVDAVSTADAPIKKGEKLGTAKAFRCALCPLPGAGILQKSVVPHHSGGTDPADSASDLCVHQTAPRPPQKACPQPLFFGTRQTVTDFSIPGRRPQVSSLFCALYSVPKIRSPASPKPGTM